MLFPMSKNIYIAGNVSENEKLITLRYITTWMVHEDLIKNIDTETYHSTYIKVLFEDKYDLLKHNLSKPTIISFDSPRPDVNILAIGTTVIICAGIGAISLLMISLGYIKP